jgi:hypothetical protein
VAKYSATVKTSSSRICIGEIRRRKVRLARISKVALITLGDQVNGVKHAE